MANPIDPNSLLGTRNSLFQQLLGRPLNPEDINAVGGEQGLQQNYATNPASGMYGEIINSPEYLNTLKTQAAARFAPEKTAAVNAATDAYTQANDTAVKSADTNRRAFEERQNQLGLLSAGTTGLGEGNIATDLTKTQGLNARDLAAKTTAANSQFDANTQDLIGKLTQQAQDHLSAIQKGEESQKQAQLDLQTKALAIAATVPRGQTINIPGLGTIQGLKEPAASSEIVNVGNRQVLIDKNTGNVIKDLGATSYKPTASSSTKAFKAPAYKQQSNDIGGLSFFNDKGQPITASQYIASQNSGGNVDAQAMINLLSKSKDPGDKQIISDINAGMSIDQLNQKYPYVFGGV